MVRLERIFVHQFRRFSSASNVQSFFWNRAGGSPSPPSRWLQTLKASSGTRTSPSTSRSARSFKRSKLLLEQAQHHDKPLFDVRFKRSKLLLELSPTSRRPTSGRFKRSKLLLEPGRRPRRLACGRCFKRSKLLLEPAVAGPPDPELSSLQTLKASFGTGLRRDPLVDLVPASNAQSFF